MDADLRPTPDRVRETVFNWLGQDMSGRRCLDLFAGSGAMGFEAASRGADEVIMVEPDPGVSRAIRTSMGKLQAGQIQLATMDALTFLESNQRRFDVIFLDPPYRLNLLPGLLSQVGGHLVGGGVVYTENDKPLQPGSAWETLRCGRAGNVYFQLLKPLEPLENG